MYTPRKTVKEKVERQETFEKPKVITNIPVAKSIESIMSELELYMGRHNFPNGWKREIKEILKPLVQ